MGKSKAAQKPKRKSGSKKLNVASLPKVIPVKPVESEMRTSTWQENLFHSVLGLLLLFAEAGMAFLFFRESQYLGVPLWLKLMTRLTGLFSLTLGLIVMFRYIRRDQVTKEWIFLPKTRTQGIVVLACAYFTLAALSIPYLYQRGYISSFTQWLQAWLPIQKVSENASVSIAFIAGAIVSGVLGNFSYDLLKLAAKKLFGPKS